MRRTEVYSWRIEPRLKQALEDAARAEGTSVSKLLDRITWEWLRNSPGAEDEKREQRRLHEAARRCLGTLKGGGPDLAESAGSRIKEVIRKRRGRKRTH